MRYCYAVLCLALPFATFTSRAINQRGRLERGQTAILAGKPIPTVKLNGIAELIAGSQRETWNVEVEIAANGSTSAQGIRSKDRRTEMQPPTDSAITRPPTNTPSAIHSYRSNCSISTSRFARILSNHFIVQSSRLLTVMDD
jgi:hypothetical protein